MEIEVPLEQVQEQIQEKALHEGGGLFTLGALLSAFLAVFAAVSALLAGHHANEAMIDRIRASDHWSYYQAKGIKASVLETRRDVLEALGKSVPENIATKLEGYRAEQAKIQESAREEEESSLLHLTKHETLAKAVTLFQVAIALTAIAMLVRRRALFFVSATLGIVGIGFLIQAKLENQSPSSTEPPASHSSSSPSK